MLDGLPRAVASWLLQQLGSPLLPHAAWACTMQRAIRPSCRASASPPVNGEHQLLENWNEHAC